MSSASIWTRRKQRWSCRATKQGRAGTLTHDDKRHGTATPLAALDAAGGKAIGEGVNRHRHQEFLRVLRIIDRDASKPLDLHLICDNYATHKHLKVKARLARHTRFPRHFTPTSASWLNPVERFFGLITEQAIWREVFHSVPDLESRIDRRLDNHNANPKPFVRTATTNKILDKVTRAKQASES